MPAKAKGIPPSVQYRLTERVERYAKENLAGQYTRIAVSFRGQHAYIDLYSEPEEPHMPAGGETLEAYIERLRNTPQHLCRLRYQGSEEDWGFAFYTYAHEKYEPSTLITGLPFGTPEDALATSTLFL